MGSSKQVLVSVCVVYFLLLAQPQVLCSPFKVGDLDSWGIPTDSNPQIYTKWPKSHKFKIGDTLLFLYPPSQDSLIQVTQESHKSCNTKDPILYMNNGNSVFNITKNGAFYFTSGEAGHCQKKQKIIILVGSLTGSADSPSDSALPDTDTAAPSYQNAFGSIPLSPSYSPSTSARLEFPLFLSLLITSLVSFPILLSK